MKNDFVAPLYYGWGLCSWLAALIRTARAVNVYNEPIVSVTKGQISSLRNFDGRDLTIPSPSVQGWRFVYGCHLVPDSPRIVEHF